MKSGMLAADAIAEALAAGREGGDELSSYVDAFKASWLYDELFRSRNFGAAIPSSALSAAARSTSSTRTSSAARSPSPCMTTSRTTPA